MLLNEVASWRTHKETKIGWGMELLFHLFFIICHPYIPIHFVEMIFYTCFTHFFMGQASQKPTLIYNHVYCPLITIIIHLQYVRALLWYTSGMIPTMAQKYSGVFHFSFDCLLGHSRFQQFSNHMQISYLDVCSSMWFLGKGKGKHKDSLVSSCEAIKACT